MAHTHESHADCDAFEDARRAECGCAWNAAQAADGLLDSLHRISQLDRRLGGDEIHRCSEWTFAARIALYLACGVECGGPDDDHLRVDVEYNRLIDDRKRDGDGKLIRADLCIHRRRAVSHDLLLAEIKSPNLARQVPGAITKLQGLTSGAWDIKYDMGALVLLAGEVRWFCGGEEVGCDEFPEILT